ncbi:MAG TPA: hypothetical protein PLP17_02455, partial [Oligoflexia bacterium]|nr:hypothetical protein [Oligoflexia bacterium]
MAELEDISLHCSKCRAEFRVAEWDRRFLDQLSVPLPRLCPQCRRLRRLVHVNQVHLFRRTCGATKKQIISNYPPESVCPVYDQAYWWSDAFDAVAYGRDYDFSRSFFSQFQELSSAVPRPALFTDYTRDENSAYTNYAGLNKNCYMIFDSDENWDCYYSSGMNGSRSSMDCYRVQNVELCYEAVDCTNCYSCLFAANCEDCFDCAFVQNCIGCKKCLFCSNLRQKEYYYRNQRVSPAEFSRLWAEFASFPRVERQRQQFGEWKRKFPQKFMRGYKNENVTGNYLVNCKNAVECYDSMNLWDCKYCTQVFMSLRDSLDCHECGESQLLYECSHTGYNAYNVMFTSRCLKQLTNLFYCLYCFNGCADLFGCVGLKRRQYCILNKHYSKEDYLALRGKIIEQMQAQGEWGEYFPAELSAFPYNLTVAEEYYPLSREQALGSGYAWYEEPPRDYRAQTCVIADTIMEIPESITSETL